MQNVKMIKDFAKPSFFTPDKHKLAAYLFEKGGTVGNVTNSPDPARLSTGRYHSQLGLILSAPMGHGLTKSQEKQ